MPTHSRPQGCTHFRLRRLGRLVGRHYDAHIAASGLRTTQFSLLSHVLRLGPIRPVDLARALNVEASTLSRNLRPMLDAGWLEQSRGVDARSRLVSITSEGRAKRAEAQAHWRVAQQGLNDRLGVDRVLALHALIDDSLDVLQRAGFTDDEEIDA